MATRPAPAATPAPTRDAAASGLDRLAIALSGLCALHCIATVALAATFATAGAALANPAWHEAGFAVAIAIGAVALGRGYAVHRSRRPLAIGASGLALMAAGLVLPHGTPEIAATMAGVALLALAHRMNAHHHPLARPRIRA